METHEYHVGDWVMPVSPSAEPLTPGPDVVTRPVHYTDATVEPVLYAMLNNLPGWQYNVVKYAWRAGKKLYPGKDAKQSELIDLEKAKRNIELRIRQLEIGGELTAMASEMARKFTTKE